MSRNDQRTFLDAETTLPQTPLSNKYHNYILIIMDLVVVIGNNNVLAATMLKPFTDSLGRTVRDQLLQLLPEFLGSFFHQLLFKMAAQALSVTFNQLFESALKSITHENLKLI
ncbi:hypothetical protein CONCODRAFT_10286 [Conidiobolus coronatus NRRL 28638]|uniref:Uncharacterized protein n=1 Tax=Conidiobolus coronatus (strain ATCC 28846 / CBS 209.66 / NRRL 28638) TaxID=796925 RepID=A0A137NY00_CONC2|nr:hypothetical protein CONCODRAFT_10286 [Conidiobolus coronatus NRRL 28638]|eukprot:KXN67627.1 hypothetical protein CONCODRAFT_10286 [Conidiobolus coronatus NRRL 28638]